MNNRTIKSQVISGLWLTGKTLLAVFTAGALVLGVTGMRNPEVRHPGPLHPFLPLVPWILLTIATVVLIATMDRWVTILPGILGYGTIGGLIMFATGQYNRLRIARMEALILTLFLVASCALALTFVGRRLNLLDRIVLLAFVYCVAVSVTRDTFVMSTALGIGLGLLLLAWAVNRLKQRRGENSPHRGDSGTAHAVS